MKKYEERSKRWLTVTLLALGVVIPSVAAAATAAHHADDCWCPWSCTK